MLPHFRTCICPFFQMSVSAYVHSSICPYLPLSILLLICASYRMFGYLPVSLYVQYIGCFSSEQERERNERNLHKILIQCEKSEQLETKYSRLKRIHIIMRTNKTAELFRTKAFSGIATHSDSLNAILNKNSYLDRY